MITDYCKPDNIKDALKLLSNKAATALAGGTVVLSFGGKLSKTVVDLGKILPKVISVTAAGISIGSGATFQEIIEADCIPTVLKNAALTMENRNIRNRATIGGNIASFQPTASLVPTLLVLGAILSVENSNGNESLSLSDWLKTPTGIITSINIPKINSGYLTAVSKANGTCSTIAIGNAACGYYLENGLIKNLTLALGGAGPKAEIRQDIASLFEGKKLLSPIEIENMVLPMLSTISDTRGSAEWKKARLATLISDVLLNVETYK